MSKDILKPTVEVRFMRLDKAIGKMDSSIDYGIVLKPENIFYLTGFFPSAFAVLVLGDAPFLGVSEMDASLAEKINLEVRVVKSFKKELSFKGKVGIEKRHTTVSFAGKFLDGCEIVDLKFISEMRTVKDRGELDLIIKAVQTTEDVLENLSLHGLTERKAAAEIAFNLNKIAASAFDPIVATKSNSAVPHHRPSDDIVSSSGPVIVDLGARVGYYNCDMTRTFSESPSEKLRAVYQAVVEAQKEGIKHLRPGASAKDCDSAVRSVLGEYGFEEYFIHSTGHGVGLEVHEAPRISKDTEDALKEGMVVCIEPGVYIPGWGGVRIEDVVSVGKKPKALTSFPKLRF
jgi:Xaa-Pro aminopeptidase